jgi:fructokinase
MRTGIDLGGTKIEIAVLDPAGELVARQRVSTPAGDYDATLRTIRELAERVEVETGQRMERLGVGTPGSLSPATGLIRNANSTCLNGRPLDRDLAAATGRAIRLENDANCFALAEARAGAAQGADTVFGVILGTGIGGGIVTGGRVLTGRNRIAGEWGHNPLPSSGPGESRPPDCYCGRQGCIEAWCSGPALAADHMRRTGSDMDAATIAGFAEAGDLDAVETLDLHLDRLARAMASVVNILDPDIIVLGGGLSNLAGLAGRLPEAMRRHVFSDTFVTPVVRNGLGDSAGVIGAAWLWPEETP